MHQLVSNVSLLFCLQVDSEAIAYFAILERAACAIISAHVFPAWQRNSIRKVSPRPSLKSQKKEEGLAGEGGGGGGNILEGQGRAEQGRRHRDMSPPPELRDD